MGLPQLLAGLDVEERQGEENDREQQHGCILHGRSRSSGRVAPIGSILKKQPLLKIGRGAVAPKIVPFKEDSVAAQVRVSKRFPK
jgi:hypothetical protein